MAKNKWMVGMALVAFAMTGCGVQVEEPKDITVNEVKKNADLVAMQMAWENTPIQSQSDMCDAWIENPELALGLFYGTSDAETTDMPAPSTVRQFFTTKCV